MVCHSLPRLVDPEYTIVFGHWASLEGKGTPEGVIGLDTGCCWGGDLTMLRWESGQYYTQVSNRDQAMAESAVNAPSPLSDMQ